MSDIFALSPPTLKASLIFFAVAFLIPVGTLGFAVAFSNNNGIPIRTTTLILIAALIPFIAISWSALTRRSLEINGSEIIVKAAFYTVRIKRSDVKTNIQMLNLEKQSSIDIASRGNGIGLPGYQVGWFTLKNGREVFSSVTSKNILYIPTTKNFDLIVSLPEAKNALDRLNGIQ